MKEIIYTAPDGHLRRVLPSHDDRTRPQGETEDELLARVIARAVPSGLSYQVITPPPTPHDRYFREAWEEGLGQVVINMPKARDIHMDNIRVVRDRELGRLDIEWMRASEAEDAVAKTRIAGLKNTLRDIPHTFDLAVHITPEALRAAWPTALPPQ